ncbi:hypothetical protein GCM10023322_00440 [Rugosimonospora acidiphila]|uniref:Restriction endonuclease n=1 Tax=Rugosimonospora acidiphila TaxID=556531 RepID=A0ABP9RGE0_9ACTN
MNEGKEYPQPSSEELISALDQTGFLFEQRVAQVFASRKAFEDVDVGVPYTDSDTGKTRELDVLAHYGEYVGDFQMSAPLVTASIIVECKNTKNPFVVIGDTVSNIRHLSMANTYLAEFDPLTLGFKDGTSTPHQLNFHNLEGGPGDAGFLGTQLVRLNLAGGKWRADNNGVYDSIIYPLAKGTRAQMTHDFVKEGVPEELVTPCFCFYSSVVVTNGPIYTVTQGITDASVNQVRWAPFERGLREEKLTGTFLFEIVEFDHLEEYLDERFFRFISSVEKRLAENARVFDPAWLLHKFGQPSRLNLYEAWAAGVEARKVEGT